VRAATSPVATALAAYSDIHPEVLEVFVDARRFQGAMWSVLLDFA
jgi:hypothetical protein